MCLIAAIGCGSKQAASSPDPYAQAAQQAQAPGGLMKFNTSTQFQDGVRLFKNGDYAAAARVWEHLLSIAPADFPQAYQTNFNLGVAYMQLNKPHDAVPHFAQAAQIEPDNAKAWVMLGQALLAIDSIEDARDALSKALTLSPNMPEALITAAAIDFRLADYPAAALHYEQALGVGADPEAANSGVAAAHLQWGRELLAAGDPASAVAHLLRAQQIDAQDAQTAYLLGRAYILMGNLDQGIESLRQAQRIDPNWVAQHRDAFAPYAQQGGENPAVHVQVADSLVVSGKYDLAALSYERALQVDWNQSQVHLTLARLYNEKLGNKEKAQEHYQAFITLAPADIQVPQARKEMELLAGPPEETSPRVVKIEVGRGQDPLTGDLTGVGSSFPAGSTVYRQVVFTGLWGRHIIVKKTLRPGGALYYAEPLELEFFTKHVRLLSKDRLTARGTWRQMWYVDGELAGTVEWTVE